METMTLDVDANQALEFFSTLFDRGDGELEPTEIRLIHPTQKTSSGKSLITNGWGTLETKEDIEAFAQLNNDGYGVYAVINVASPSVAKKINGITGIVDADIKKITAVFAELDDEKYTGENLEKLSKAALEPSMIVQSSVAGKLHAYWLLEDCPVENFRALQIQLIELLGSDPTCKNESRVMRVPGFYHTKKEPIMTRILSNTGISYTLAEFCEAFGFDPDYQLHTEAPLDLPDDWKPAEGISARIVNAGKKKARAVTGSGRHKTLIWAALSCQENRLSFSEAIGVMTEVTNYLPTRDGVPVPLAEAQDVLEWVYAKATPSNPWAEHKSDTRGIGTANGLLGSKSKQEFAESTASFDQYKVDILIKNQGYAQEKEGKEGPSYVQLTNWTFEPVLQLVFPDGSIGERGALSVNGAVLQVIDLPSTVWNSRKDVLTHIGRYGCVCFTNSSSDIAKIKQYILLNYANLPVAYGVKSFGLHELNEQRILLYSNETIYQGETPPIFYAGVPVETNAYKFEAPRVYSLEDLQEAKEAITKMKSLMTLSAALGIMGYAVASAFAPMLWREFDGGKVYFGFVEGERETGKSTFIELALRMATGSSARQQMAASISPYQYDVAASNANNMLVFLDEYKKGEVDFLDTLIRAHHDVEVKTRGTGVAGRHHEYIRNAPMIINGEGFSTDPATRSRGVLFYPERKDRGDKETFNEVRTAPLEALARHLHTQAKDISQKDFLERLEVARAYAKNAIKRSTSPRLFNSLTFIAFGLETLKIEVDDTAFDEANISFALAEIAQNTLEGGDESKSNLEVFLEELAYALSTINPKAIENYVIPSTYENNLILRLTPCMQLTRKVMQGHEAMRSTTVLQKSARQSEFFVNGDNHESIVGKRCRGLRLKLNEIPKRVDAGLLVKFYEDLKRAYQNVY